MARPTARVLALLELLQSSSRTRTVTDLAERLGVDERTVRRYVAHLTDLDIPVESVRGPHGGIRLAPAYRVPPLMLTDEEALAVLLGLAASQRAALAVSSAAVVETAASKIRRVLPVALARRLEALLQTTGASGAEPVTTTPQAGVLLALAAAARDRRPVALHHTAAGGRRTRRTVHPYGIVAHAGRWYLSAADAASGELRTFRVDRVEVATALTGTFDVPEGFDPVGQVVTGLAEAPWRHEVRLRVRAGAQEVTGLFPPGLVTVDDGPVEPGWSRVRMRAERLDWVPGVLAGVRVPFQVEGPDALREMVRTLADRLAAAATPPTAAGGPPPGG